MSDRPFVFISCGQLTEAERQLGSDIADLVRTLTPFDPYFADFVTSLDGLTYNIFDKLQKATGYIFVFHNRGSVQFKDHSRNRASVWVEQELAIASYLRQVSGKKSHLAAYIERDVSREGVRDALLLNPTEFTSADEVLAHLRAHLPDWAPRLAPATPTAAMPSPLSTEWFTKHEAIAIKSLQEAGFSNYMEIRCHPTGVEFQQASAAALVDTAGQAVVRGSGWPIGVIDRSGKQPPRTVRDGFTSEILRPDQSYDYFSVTCHGQIFILRNLWETWAHSPNTLVGEVRVTQVLEAVLFCARLLLKMGLSKQARLPVSVRHVGYAGFTYTRYYRGRPEEANKVDANEALDVLEISIGDLLNRDGRLRAAPFMALTSDLFRSADFYGVPPEEFFNECIHRRLEMEAT